MTFSSKLVEPRARTVKVDFCLLLRETMPSQRADVWAKADMEGKRTSIAASNNVMRCFTMESAPLVIRDFLLTSKTGSIVHPFSLARRCGVRREQISGDPGQAWLAPDSCPGSRSHEPVKFIVDSK